MAKNIAPGYCIVEQPGSLIFQAGQMFNNRNSTAARHFVQINRDTPWVKPGQILIIADPDDTMTGQMLRALRQAKQQVNNALIGTSTDDAIFFQRHYGMIAGLTSAGDKIFGAAGDVGEKYFTNIETTLKKIEATYQNQFRTQGTLIGQQFFVERNRLFTELKELVNKPLVKSLAKHSVKFRPYSDMRKALNLSSRSLVHEWSTVGIGAIPGYATYTSGAAKAARFLKYGGYIGIGFSFANTSNDVALACTTGRENECGKVAFKEYSKFGFSTAGGLTGGALGATAGGAICVGLGIITAPAAGFGGFACAAIGSLAGGYLGSNSGEAVIDYLIKD
ncbi:TPA: hypothetical protein G8051_004731 [Salmonella enterica]|nr:hypothetical protein [Salmonella enterica]